MDSGSDCFSSFYLRESSLIHRPTTFLGLNIHAQTQTHTIKAMRSVKNNSSILCPSKHIESKRKIEHRAELQVKHNVDWGCAHSNGFSKNNGFLEMPEVIIIPLFCIEQMKWNSFCPMILEDRLHNDIGNTHWGMMSGVTHMQTRNTVLWGDWRGQCLIQCFLQFLAHF